MIYILDRFFLLFGQIIRLRKYYIMAQPIVLMKAPARPGKNFEVKLVGQDEFHQLSQNRLGTDEIQKRYENGAKCYVVFEGTSVAGYLWFGAKQYQEKEDRSLFVLDDELVWDFDVYIEPKYRFSNAFIQLWEYVDRELMRSHIKYTVSRVMASNYRSLSSHRRLGARSVFWLLYLTLLNLQITISSNRPFIWIGLNRGNMPVYRIKYVFVKSLFEKR